MANKKSRKRVTKKVARSVAASSKANAKAAARSRSVAKRTGKSVVRETRKTGRNIRTNVKAASKVLRTASRVLGARKKESKKKSAKKKSVTMPPIERGGFTLREVIGREGISINDALAQAEKKAAKYQKRRKKNESFGFEIAGARSTILATTLTRLLAEIAKYDTVKKYGRQVNDNTEYFIDNLRIFRVSDEDITEFSKEIKAGKQAREERKARIRKRVSEELTPLTKLREPEVIPTPAGRVTVPRFTKRQRKTATDIMEDMLTVFLAQKTELQAALDRVAALEAQLAGKPTPPKKGGKKRVNNKRTTNSGRKKGTGKSTAKPARTAKRAAKSAPKKSNRKAKRTTSVKKSAPAKRTNKLTAKKSAPKKTAKKPARKKGKKK
jgi:hypothetical protein